MVNVATIEYEGGLFFLAKRRCCVGVEVGSGGEVYRANRQLILTWQDALALILKAALKYKTLVLAGVLRHIVLKKLANARVCISLNYFRVNHRLPKK